MRLGLTIGGATGLPGPVAELDLSSFGYGAITFVGDSITAGGAGGVPSYAIDLTADEFKADLDNKARSGSVLQNGPIAGGEPNQHNLLDNLFAYTVGTGSDAIISAIGFNDARYTASDDLSTAQFVEAYRTCLRRWLDEYGRDNIWLVTPWLISDAGLGAGSTWFSGQSRAGFEAYVAAVRDLAREFAVRLIDPYAAGVPSTTVDSLHPDMAALSEMSALFVAPVTSSLPLPDEAPTPTKPETISVPANTECFLLDGIGETALTEGDNTVGAGTATLAYRQAGTRWELIELQVEAASGNTAASFLELDETPAATRDFTASGASADTLSLSAAGSGTTRAHYSFALDAPPGASIRFDYSVASDAVFVVRTSAAADLGSTPSEDFVLHSDMSGGRSGQLFARMINPQAYFGLILTDEGSVDLSNFSIIGVPSSLTLEVAPDSSRDLSAEEVTADRLKLSSIGTGTSRAHHTLAINDTISPALPAGSAIAFDFTISNGETLIVRLASDGTLQNGVEQVLSTASPSGSVSYTVGADHSHLGFLTLGECEIEITNFAVTLP